MDFVVAVVLIIVIICAGVAKNRWVRPERIRRIRCSKGRTAGERISKGKRRCNWHVLVSKLQTIKAQARAEDLPREVPAAGIALGRDLDEDVDADGEEIPPLVNLVLANLHA